MNPHPEIYPEEEGIDLKKYLFRILYNWWWFALSLFVALTTAYLVNRYSTKIYQASCSVIAGNINPSGGDVESLVDDLTKSRNRRAKTLIENEITILKSYKMARMALEQLEFGITYTKVGRRGIAELQMYQSSPFILVPDSFGYNQRFFPVIITILSSSRYRVTLDKPYKMTRELNFGEHFNIPVFNFKILPRTAESIKNLPYYPQKFYVVMNDINGLANSYRAMLSISRNDEKGSILSLSLTGTNREQICDYLNKLSKVYITSNLDEKNAASSSAIRFIDEQLGEITRSLHVTGSRLQNFRSENRIINLSTEGNTLYKQMESLNTEKADHDIMNSYYAYIKGYIEAKKDTIEIMAPSLLGIQDELLNRLVADANKLITEKRNLKYNMNAGNPMLDNVNTRLENVRQDILENIENIIASNEISSKSLNDRIAGYEQEIKKLPFTERQLISIQRDYNLNDKIYTFLLKKRAEASITKASNISDNRLLDKALPDNAAMIRPKISANYLLALVTGGLLPLLVLILIEYFNTKIIDRKDIERLTSVPILGSVGHQGKTQDLPVFENPKSSLAESFRSLRANLQYFLKEENKKVISVSSAISGEGKTFCAANLAAILAMAGRKTLLVSLDLRKPKIHRLFKLNNTEGLSSYLAGISPLEKTIQPSNVQHLFVAVSGPVPPNPAELIGSARMTAFMNTMKQQYDYIIIDTPPVAIVTDALLLKELVDIHVFVVRHGYSDKQVLKLIEDLYTKRGITSMALFINDVQTKGYYGYGYRYSYGYGYGYGYGYEHDYYGETKAKSKLLARLLKFLVRKK